MECICEGLQEYIMKSSKEMIAQGAPEFLIQDHIMDLVSGGWGHCKCEASKEHV